MPSVSRPLKGCLQALTLPSSNQYTTIIGSKTETALIREHKTSPLHCPMISSVTSLKSQLQGFGVNGTAVLCDGGFPGLVGL
ncbi:hypothetical protein TNCV_4609691 [Trichonephila clavipes]|nr:hypothetical protein TNCV_4609691 [Trichonephila clavipes]